MFINKSTVYNGISIERLSRHKDKKLERIQAPKKKKIGEFPEAEINIQALSCKKSMYNAGKWAKQEMY